VPHSSRPFRDEWDRRALPLSEGLRSAPELSKTRKNTSKNHAKYVDLRAYGPFQTRHFASNRPLTTRRPSITSRLQAVCPIPPGQSKQNAYRSKPTNFHKFSPGGVDHARPPKLAGAPRPSPSGTGKCSTLAGPFLSSATERPNIAQGGNPGSGSTYCQGAPAGRRDLITLGGSERNCTANKIQINNALSVT